MTSISFFLFASDIDCHILPYYLQTMPVFQQPRHFLKSAFLLFSLIHLGDSLKHNFSTNDDERTLIGPLGFPFGFLDSGHYQLDVFNFEIMVGKHADHEHVDEETAEKAMNEVKGVGFLLKRFEDESDFNHYMNEMEQDPSKCVFQTYLDENSNSNQQTDDTNTTNYAQVMDAASDGIFLNMKSFKKWEQNKGVQASYDFKRGEAGFYFLIFQICGAPKESVHAHFELDFHFSNQDMFRNTSFLSAGQMILPPMYFYFFLFYTICSYLWITNINQIQQGKPGHFSDPQQGQPIVYPIHNLMSLLLILKTSAIFCESVRYHYLRVTGHAELWSVVFYTFAFLKGTILFTVILLIGSGWSFVKPFLSDKEKQVAFAILVLQVINNIAIVVLTQETEGEIRFDNWTAVLHLVDILCCCAVLVPIVWHINSLEKNMEQSKESHTTDIGNNSDAIISEMEFEDEYQETRADKKLSEKLKLFRRFYGLVVAYIYTTRIIVYLFATMLTYRHEWVRPFVVEGVTLAFYFTVGSLFLPMCENPYFSVNKSQRETEIELTT